MQIWAHRGASGYAPENTLEAFDLAIKQGADGIELDVQVSRDGELVVIHDERIDRVSNGNGWVKDFTLAELKKFYFNKTKPEYKKTRVATLKDVYALLKETNVMINVELKTGLFFYKGIEEKTLDLSAKLGMEDRVIYSSFNHYSVLLVKKLQREAKTGFLVMDGAIDLPQYVKQHSVDALHSGAYHLRYPGLIESCKQMGIAIRVWNVRDEDVCVCEALGVDAVITNYPDRSRLLLSANQERERI